MKKNVLFVFGLLSLSFASFASNKADTILSNDKIIIKKEDNNAKKPIILTTYEPGSFSAGVFGCWGSGVCRRDIIINDNSKSKSEVKADTEITNNLDGTLTIKFVYSSMNKKNQEYYSDRSTFVLEEDFPLNKEEILGLGLKSKTVLKKGEYDIVKGKNTLSVIVKI